MSYSDKADVLSIVAELELADKFNDGSLILVLVLQVACKVVVPVVRNLFICKD